MLTKARGSTGIAPGARLPRKNRVYRSASCGSSRAKSNPREEPKVMEAELDELTLPDILLLLESLEYSRMNITHDTAPYY